MLGLNQQGALPQTADTGGCVVSSGQRPWCVGCRHTIRSGVEPGLGLLEPLRDETFDRVRGVPDLEGELLPLDGGVVGEDEVGDRLTARRAADAGPDAVEVAGAEEATHRAQAVVAVVP